MIPHFRSGSFGRQPLSYASVPKEALFATPYHAWERGLNENTNGLIRDFFPKGTDFSTISSAEVAKVERLLNARPRKSLGFRSPQEVFHSLAYS
jgi:transposase, IS30 family